MTIHYISGDIFVNTHGAVALAHGCNCIGVMGAGVAKEMRRRYPEMYAQYRAMCKAKPREFNPGDVFLWQADDTLWVFNLATQANTSTSRAKYPHIETSLKSMRQLADQEGITSIAMPAIGAGLGGLKWDKVRDIIDAVFADWSGDLYVYEAYVPGQ